MLVRGGRPWNLAFWQASLSVVLNELTRNLLCLEFAILKGMLTFPKSWH